MTNPPQASTTRKPQVADHGISPPECRFGASEARSLRRRAEYIVDNVGVMEITELAARINLLVDIMNHYIQQQTGGPCVINRRGLISRDGLDQLGLLHAGYLVGHVANLILVALKPFEPCMREARG